MFVKGHIKYSRDSMWNISKYSMYNCKLKNSLVEAADNSQLQTSRNEFSDHWQTIYGVATTNKFKTIESPKIH